MNVITREDSDYDLLNLDSRIKKVRAQIRFIKHLFDVKPDILIAGGCAYDHANRIPAKDIDVWLSSEEELNNLVQQLDIVDAVDQTSDKEYPDTEIERVIMYTVRYKGKGYLLNTIILRTLRHVRPDIEDRMDYVFRKFPYSDNLYAYYKDQDLGLGIIAGNDMPIAYQLRPFKGEVEAAKVPAKYLRKRLLTVSVTPNPNRAPFATRRYGDSFIMNHSGRHFYMRRPAFYPVLSKGYISQSGGRWSDCHLVSFINHGSEREEFYYSKSRGFTLRPREVKREIFHEATAAAATPVFSTTDATIAGTSLPAMWTTRLHNTISGGSLSSDWVNTGTVTQELQPDRGPRTEMAQPTAGQRIRAGFASIFGSLS